MSDLRERVAKEMMDAVGCAFPDNAEWRAYRCMADAAIALVLEEAAKVANGCDDGSSQEGPLTAHYIAAAIRALKEKSDD